MIAGLDTRKPATWRGGIVPGDDSVGAQPNHSGRQVKTGDGYANQLGYSVMANSYLAASLTG